MSTPNPAVATNRHLAAPAHQRIQGHQTFLRTIHAEWIKVRSLTSTWVTSLVTIGITVLFGAGIAIGYSGAESMADEAKHMIAAGSSFGQIVVAVLGALVITGEYSSGQIRSSLAAVPHRGRILMAKATIVSALSFALGSLSVLLAWAASTPFMHGHAGSLTDAHYFGYVWGTGLSFALIALMALGLGFLMRSTAGSITVVMTLLFVIIIPLQLIALKWEWATKAAQLLPTSTATAIADPFSLAHTWAPEGTTFLTQGQAALVCVVWALVPLLLGWAAFRHRDA